MNSYMPTKVFTGFKVLEKNDVIFKDLGKTCLIVTSPNSAKKSGALDDILTIFNKYDIKYDIYDKIEQNPSVKSCIEAGIIANSIKADYIVGIGGGSPLDASKTAAIVATNPTITEDEIYNYKWTNKPLPYVLIGTTSGTGSEVTKVSVMTNSQKKKKSINHEDLYALYSFGDHRYTLSVPESFRKSTALDALAHLCESYFSNKADDISRAYSLQGVSIIYPVLKDMATNKELNIDKLETLYNASILGGYAINITGTVFCHTLSYHFTENYNMPHGFACAIFMNDLIDFELNNNKEYAEEFFTKLNINIDEYKQTISCLLPTLDFKLTKEEIKNMLIRYTDNKNVKNTYGNMSLEDVEEILNKLL